MHKINLSDDIKNKIIDMYENYDVTLEDIAKEVNVSEGTIKRWVRLWKLKKYEKYSYITERVLKELYITKNMTMQEIARELGTYKGTIQRKIEKFKIQKGGIEPVDRISNDKFIELVNQKATLEEIKRVFNCSSQTVKKKLKTLNINRNNYHKGRKFKKLLIDVENPVVLKYLYITKRNSVKELSKKYDCCEEVVRKRLKELDLKQEEDYIPKEVLEALYFDRDLGIRSMSKLLGVTERLIKVSFKKHGIDKKKSQWAHITTEVLKKLYVDEGLNVPEIARKFGCDTDIISSRIYSYNLTALRTPEEHAKSIARSYKAISTRSKGEEEIRELFPTEHLNTHDVLGWELDLWYPEKGVAVEYNGDYWHSRGLGRASRHIAKTTICEQKGIHLINIFERFWRNEDIKPKIINILNNFISKEKLKRVDGEIKEVSKQEEQEFIRKFNIEKVISSDIAIGTFNKDGFLLNMISLNTKTPDFKITRFTTRIGYVEDYKKLINYIKDNMNCRSIEVSCDRRYYHGELFKELGFEFMGNTKAEHTYVHNHESISRLTYNKNPEKYKSYTKVYDCGRMKLRLTL